MSKDQLSPTKRACSCNKGARMQNSTALGHAKGCMNAASKVTKAYVGEGMSANGEDVDVRI